MRIEDELGRHFGRPANARWWPHVKKRVRPAVRLFCFPFSGGSSASFAHWHNLLPDFVEVYPAELPGRAQRLLEPGITSFDDAVSTLVPVILPLTDLPFALFGHSMGAFLAFELARVLQSEHQRPPAKLFVSGSPSPTAMGRISQRSDMSDSQLIGELERLGGTPPAVLSNPELLELVLPAVRSDFELTQNYRYCQGAKLSCPVRAFAGWSDTEAQPHEVDRWCDITSADFDITVFLGDHFFVQPSAEEILTIIAADLGQFPSCRGPRRLCLPLSAAAQ